ncbi:MAG: NYN domain-containing protein [bacterium]|nr:NYN domain-containing protein [bacterium]
MADETSNIAVYIDLENVAIGVSDARLKSFDVDLVFARLVDKGNLVVRKAYADWGRYDEYKRPLHAAGVELIDLPGSRITGKNSADIKMVVDALELSYTKPHIDTFALVTGDSDFYPLVAKLRENNKHTMAVGVKNSTSPLLIDSCDEFIFYDDLVRKPAKRKRAGQARLGKEKQEAFALLLDAVEALQREDKHLYSSLVKETMKRKQPQFNEEYHGYRSFTRLLEDAEKNQLVTLRRDERSGTLVIDEVLEESS